jgi:hypothetical protein
MGGVVCAERMESDREQNRHEEAARGAARLFVDEFRTVGLYFERTLQNGVWEPVPSDARIRLSDEDRKLMSANLKPDEWGRASEAATVTNRVLGRLRARGEGRPYLSLLRRTEQQLITLALNELNEGREALRPLSGESPAVIPKPPLRRPQSELPPPPEP